MAGISDVWKVFKESYGGRMTAFKEEWDALTDADKEQLIAGCTDGSLTY